MANEKWMYTSGPRATLERLERISGTRIAAVLQKRQGDSYPLAGSHGPALSISQVPEARTANSTVIAGWICFSLGLTCAWLLPPAQVFFAVAFILSIVAMSTHQVRQGTLLLITTCIGAVGCAMMFSLFVTTPAWGFRDGAHDKFQAMTQSLLAAPPAISMPGHPTVGSDQYNAPGTVASDPLAFNDVAVMLRTGYNDDEVIAAAQSKQWVGSLDGSRINYLRSLGAGDKLINFLRGRPIFVAPPRITAPMPFLARAAAQSPPIPVVSMRGPIAQEGVVSGNPVDYQARDQRIKELKERIDALDEDVRRIRSNPKDYRYCWHYAGGYNGIDQQRLDNYLKQLDQQRNDLRREKWRLEGR